MIRWLISAIITLSLGLTTTAQDFDKSDYEAFIEETMSASNIPGLAAIIFNENGTVYEKAFGIAGPDERAVTLDTPFQLGSVSKTFAALVIVQLSAEGKIDLDVPVMTYLPDFRARGSEWQDITLRHILSHRSGLSTFHGNLKQNDIYRGADALDVAVRDLRKAKLNAKPGERLEYSNANYMLAAAVIESVTGQSYETALDERIFTPLGMTNSYVQMPLRDTAKEATGYRQWFGMPIAYLFIPGRSMMAAGGVTSSASDLAIYINAVASKDPRIMPEAEFSDQLIASQGDSKERFGYGLGWMLWDEDGRNVVYHAGLNAGFSAQAGFLSSDKRGGVVLTNSSGSLQADVPGAVLRKGLGIDPGVSHPSMGQHMTIWGLLATVIILMLSFILSTVRFSAYAKRVKHVNLFRRAAPSLALFGLAYGLAVIIPGTQGVHLMGIKGFSPDIWLCLLLSVVIALIWGITRLVYPR